MRSLNKLIQNLGNFFDITLISKSFIIKLIIFLNQEIKRAGVYNGRKNKLLD